MPFAITPIATLEDPPTFIQWQRDGVDRGGPDVAIVDFVGEDLEATRGTGENSHVVTVRRVGAVAGPVYLRWNDPITDLNGATLIGNPTAAALDSPDFPDDAPATVYAGVVDYVGQVVVWDLTWLEYIDGDPGEWSQPGGDAISVTVASPQGVVPGAIGVITLSATVDGVAAANVLTLTVGTPPPQYGLVRFDSSEEQSARFFDYMAWAGAVPVVWLGQVTEGFDPASAGVQSVVSTGFNDNDSLRINGGASSVLTAGVGAADDSWYAYEVYLSQLPFSATLDAYGWFASAINPAYAPNANQGGATTPLRLVSSNFGLLGHAQGNAIGVLGRYDIAFGGYRVVYFVDGDFVVAAEFPGLAPSSFRGVISSS